MSKTRAMIFLKRTITLCILILSILFIMWVVNDQTGLFAPLLNPATIWLTQANQFLDKSMMTGISVGMIVLALLVLFLPLLMKGTLKKQYLTAVSRGTIATFIFYISQRLYSWAEKFGKSYLILSISLVIFCSFVIIEVFARFKKSEEEASFRTDMLASMSAGLVSSIIFVLLRSLFHA